MKSVFPNSMALLDPYTIKDRGKNVTIVTRTKNRPVLLPRALASVLSQTHEDWHLYVVNDGGERKPIDDLISHYFTAFNGRITAIHHEESQGMEAASNAALRTSHGDFIAIHDDDDSWHPKFLEETIEFLLASGNQRYAAVVTHCTEIRERVVDDGIVEEGRRMWAGNRKFIDFADMLQQNNVPSIALLIRRSAAQRLGYFNESLPVLGNWDFNLRLMYMGDIAVIPKSLAYYHTRCSVGHQHYSNSMSGLHQSQYELYFGLYRNSLFRASLQNGISHLGPLSLTLCAAAETRRELAELKQTLAHIQQTLAHTQQSIAYTHMVASWTCEALRPVRWIWLRTLPVRQWISRFFRRI